MAFVGKMWKLLKSLNQIGKEKQELQSSAKDHTQVKVNESIESTPLIVIKALWGHMNPSSRTKVKIIIVNEGTEKRARS